MPLMGATKAPPWLRAWAYDGGTMTASQVVLTGTATLVTVLLARSLSAYQFGVLVSFLAIAQGCSFAIDAGVGTWLLRDFSRLRAGAMTLEAQNEEIVTLLRSASIVIILLGLVATIVSVMVGLILQLGLELSLLQGSFVAYVTLLAVSTALESLVRAERQVNKVAIAILIEKACMAALVAVALISGTGLMSIGLAYIVAGLARTAVDYRYTFAGLPTGVGRTIGFRSILRTSLPFASNTAALSVVPRLDIPLIALISATSASYYNLGYQVVTTAALLPAIAGVTLLPFIPASNGASAAQWRLLSGSGALGGLCALIGVVLMPIALPLVFGMKYTPAVSCAQLMLVSLPFIFYSSLSLPYLYAAGNENAVVKRTLVPSLAGSGLVVMGEVLFGPLGAAGGYVARQVLLAGVLCMLGQSLRKHSHSDNEADMGQVQVRKAILD